MWWPRVRQNSASAPASRRRERAVALVHRPLERLADVVVRLVEAVQGLDLAIGRQEELGLLGDGEHLVGVRPAHGDGLTAPCEPVLGVGADGREHRKRRAVALVAQQRRRRQLLEAGLHVDAERDEAAPLPAVEHRDRRRGPERPGDDRDAAIQPEDRLGQEADAPVHRRPQAALPRRTGGEMLRARVIGQGSRDPGGMIIGQAGLQLVDELVRRKDPQRRCRELDGQRDPVEAAADRRREHRVRGRRLDLRAADPGAGEEQLDGRVPGEDIRVGLVGRRHRQRLDPDHALAWDAERDPAGREDRQAGRPGEEVAEGGRGRPHVLDGVEDEDAGCAAERLGEALHDGAAGLLGDAHGAGDRRQDQGRVAHAVERHERDATVTPRQGPAGQLDGEAALAHAADPRERDERPIPAEREAADGGDIGLAPDQRSVGDLRHGPRPARLDRRGIGLSRRRGAW